MFCYVADDAELDLLARLVEQEEVNEHASSERNESVAVTDSERAEPCSEMSTESSPSIGDVGSCSMNCEPVADTEAEESVPDTDDECQYFLLCISCHFSF